MSEYMFTYLVSQVMWDLTVKQESQCHFTITHNFIWYMMFNWERNYVLIILIDICGQISTDHCMNLKNYNFKEDSFLPVESK